MVIFMAVGITPKEFEAMKQRLAQGKSSRRQPEAVSSPKAVASSAARIVLGIDPSLRSTGYGVLRAERSNLALVTFGVIHCPATWEGSRCLVNIARVLGQVIQEHRPSVCAIEGLFYAQNLQTALIMGQARGAALLAAADAGLPICEIAPRKMKQALVGYGAAQKFAVGKMVQRLLGLSEVPPEDAADALGLALAYAHETRRYSMTNLRPV